MKTTTELPTFETYCDNTTKGNALVFSIGGVDVYYSYKTPVAFRSNGTLVVRANIWGPTTGKHLNAIDGGDKEAKAKRVTGVTFEEVLAAVLEA